MIMILRGTKFCVWLLFFVINGCSNHTQPIAIEIRIDTDTLDSTVLSLPHGKQQSLVAIGHFLDGSKKIMDQQVHWRSTFPEQITIDQDGAVFSKSHQGGSVIYAHFHDLQSAPFVVLNEPAQLLDISIEPHSLIRKGDSRKLSLQGHFSNGEIRPISSDITWRTSAKKALSISPSGKITAHRANQTVDVTAFVGDKLSTTLSITTQPADLLRLNIHPKAITLPMASAYPLTVIATYSDGQQEDVTDKVHWQNHAPQHVHLSPKGQIVGLIQQNEVLIEAHFENATAASRITITTPLLAFVEDTH